jgi:hypothetical protein
MSGMRSVCPASHNEATRQSDLAVEIMQKLANDINKSERQSFFDIAIADRNR